MTVRCAVVVFDPSTSSTWTTHRWPRYAAAFVCSAHGPRMRESQACSVAARSVGQQHRRDDMRGWPVQMSWNASSCSANAKLFDQFSQATPSAMRARDLPKMAPSMHVGELGMLWLGRGTRLSGACQGLPGVRGANRGDRLT
jgi:hypothetical protein